VLTDWCFILASHCAKWETVFVTRLKSILVGAKPKDQWGVSRSRFKSSCLSSFPPLLGLHTAGGVFGEWGLDHLEEAGWEKVGAAALGSGPSPRWTKGST